MAWLSSWLFWPLPWDLILTTTFIASDYLWNHAISRISEVIGKKEKKKVWGKKNFILSGITFPDNSGWGNMKSSRRTFSGQKEVLTLLVAKSVMLFSMFVAPQLHLQLMKKKRMCNNSQARFRLPTTLPGGSMWQASQKTKVALISSYTGKKSCCITISTAINQFQHVLALSDINSSAVPLGNHII